MPTSKCDAFYLESYFYSTAPLNTHLISTPRTSESWMWKARVAPVALSRWWSAPFSRCATLLRRSVLSGASLLWGEYKFCWILFFYLLSFFITSLLHSLARTYKSISPTYLRAISSFGFDGFLGCIFAMTNLKIILFFFKWSSSLSSDEWNAWNTYEIIEQ